MSLFSALQNSIAGLQAQSYAMNNISGNIANSQTVGYKRIDTSFSEMVAEQNQQREAAGSVRAQAQLSNTISGNITSTGIPTNMAIDGTGFFTVVNKSMDANGASMLDSSPSYTRRGDFSRDKDGYFVNGAGGYLTGTNFDPITGNATNNGPIKIENTILPAQPSTSFKYSANLPLTAKTNNYANSKSDIYNQNPKSVILSGTNIRNVSVAKADAANFVDNSIPGPSFSAFTDAGASVTINTRWAKVQGSNTELKQPAVWNLYYASDDNSSNNSTAWQNVGTAFAFNSAGNLIKPSTQSVSLGEIKIGDKIIPNINMEIGSSGLTQYSNSTGLSSTNTLSVNGNSASKLTNISIDTGGKINGSFANGSILALATVGIAQFTNPNGMKVTSNGNYLQTAESGPPLTGLNGGTIVGSSVEQSNTDIASEFSKLIVTQQAYSANTRVISTAQTLMSDLMNVIR